ncbi:MAG TPA: ATP-binding protein [Planctomycetota bacterium]|nr:ATP-binding protein [Planctomycetota bacterium]
MFGARLARRIVWPLAVAVALLFVVLGFAAARLADARVEAELADKADRIAATLQTLSPPRPEILEPLAHLMGVGLVVDRYAVGPGWGADETRRLVPLLATTRLPPAEAATVGGRSYRVLRRSAGPRGPCLILEDEVLIEERQRDALVPIAVAGAVGLLVALLLGLAVARAIARPVKRLADSVRGFGEGRYEGGLGGRGPGEIGDLQDAFTRMVDAIRASEGKLRESERFAALGRLAGGIAHELRNPLTAIRMAVEAGMPADGDDGEARRIALAEIDRLDRTLRELLDFVRPRKPRLVPVDVRRLLDDVAKLLGPQCDHLRVRLEVDAPAGLTLPADEDRLKQAILNLVLNGAQAQPAGGAVRMRARGPAGGEGALVEVQDEGGGIPEEVMGSLLQPFVTTKEGGIGLGLAVVAQVAEEHGARLDFRTGKGGTTFSIRFPA